MKDLHEYYGRLTIKERQILDRAYTKYSSYLIDHDIRVCGDDRAEECINAMAKHIITSKGININQG